MNNFRHILQQVMTGRYGTDQFGKFLIIFSVVLMLLAFISRNMNATIILELVMMMALIICMFRMFSKNFPKRAHENQLYLSFRHRYLAWFDKAFENWKLWFENVKNGLSKDKTHVIFKCPQCSQKIRVPKGKGRIAIRCPKCNIEFIKKT